MKAPAISRHARKDDLGDTVSVVVAVRNEARHIESFLHSLCSQHADSLDWEIIVADGMSNDGTRQTLEKWQLQYDRIHIVDNPGKIVSTGLNTAILKSRGSIIIRMDAHTDYAPDYITRCVEILRKTGADNVGGPARTRAGGRLARAIAAAYHSPLSTGGAKFHNPEYEGHVDTVTYGCWRKQTLEEIGLFDETLVRNQDDELNFRLIRAGKAIWQSPAIKSWYHPRANLKHLFQQYFQYGFWKVAIIRKHKIPSSWRHLVPGVFVVINAVMMALVLALGVSSMTALYRSVLIAWAGLLALYILALTGGSVVAGKKDGWDLLPYLPLVFAAFHISYGLGFIAGIWHFTSKPATTQAPNTRKMFTELTR